MYWSAMPILSEIRMVHILHSPFPPPALPSPPLILSSHQQHLLEVRRAHGHERPQHKARGREAEEERVGAELMETHTHTHTGAGRRGGKRDGMREGTRRQR